MADVKWIKLALKVFDSRKIKQIEKMPDGDSILVIWFKLLCLAGNINDGGMIYFTREMPFTDEMLSTEFNRPIQTVRLALTLFQQYGMIEIIDNIYYISSWDKYQNIEGLEKIREQNRLRKQKERERKSIEMSRNSHVTVTQCHETDIDKEIDIDKDKDKTYVCDFESLWSKYPRKKEKAKAYRCYQTRLKDGYSESEMMQAVTNYAAECKKNKTAEKYIKLGATFLGVNTPFIDYLKGEDNGRTRVQANGDNELDCTKAFAERYADAELKELPFVP